MIDPFNYFFVEEFIFPAEGGVTGQCRVTCPHCGVEYDLDVEVGNTDDRYACSFCDAEFSINWVDGTVCSVS